MATSNSDMSGMKRVSANFSQSTYEALEALADAKGGSMSDALRDAIALSRWIKETQDQGGKILVEQNGKIREVLKF